MRFRTLEQWLAWQEQLHPAGIVLGLERVSAVLERLGLSLPPFPVITVAGTNGKGSTVAMLEAILQAGGCRTGTYTSPHLIRYNERIRIGGRAIEDGPLCEAFARVDDARAEFPLTYFEFGTLAAIELFFRARLDVAILEVGMGGRLDATNVLDPDVAVVTTVDIDHTQWLGPDREAIGREKAGIFRPHRPAVYGDSGPPASLVAHAKALSTPLYRFGEEYGCQRGADAWSWRGPKGELSDLPLPALLAPVQLKNAAGVLMALELLKERVPVSREAIEAGLREVSLMGRCQRIGGPVERLFDVAHNPQAAGVLAATLRQTPSAGETLAVVGVLADKDIEGVVEPLVGCVERWFAGGLHVPRGAPGERVAAALEARGAGRVASFDTVAAAYRAAVGQARPGDRIVVFGSFYSVAEALAEPV